MKGLFTLLSGAFIALALTACGNDADTTANTTPPAAAPQAAAPEVVVCNECGTISSITPIDIAGESSGAGAVIGAVIGGLAGSQVGDGKGTDAAIVVGAVGGAFLGRGIERQRNANTVYDIAINMDNDSFHILRVEEYGTLYVGQDVRVSGSTILPRQI